MCDYGMVLFLSRMALRRIGHGNTRWSFIEMASAKHADNRLLGQIHWRQAALHRVGSAEIMLSSLSAYPN